MGLRAFVIRRLFQLVITMWAFITVLFFMFRLLPGDPTSLFMAQGMDPETRDRLLEQFGFNDPLHIQYLKYIENLLTGSLGESFIYSTPVSEILLNRFINTIILMFVGMFVAYSLAILFGAYMGWNRGGRMEKFGIIYTISARSSPPFWTGVLLLIIFTFTLGWFPSGRMHAIDSRYDSRVDLFLSTEFLTHLFLPVLAIAIVFMATPTLLMRSTMLEVLNEDFIEVKKMMGFGPYTILYKHAARNSLLPVVTLAGVATGNLFGGAVIIETVFDWPGMGREMVQAMWRNDYPLAMGAFFVMGATVIIMNFVVDILYGYLDPRVTYD